MAYRRVAGTCPDGNTCPVVLTEDEQSYVVQGEPVTDIDPFTLPAGEAAVRIPRQLLEELARALRD